MVNGVFQVCRLIAKQLESFKFPWLADSVLSCSYKNPQQPAQTQQHPNFVIHHNALRGVFLILIDLSASGF
jgi:hypothetical protein